MFTISDLNKKYQYDYSLEKSFANTLFINRFYRRDSFQVVTFINEFITAHEWQWDSITYYNCRRLEYLIQEKLPSNIVERKEIYLWIVKNWMKYYFPVLKDVSLN